MDSVNSLVRWATSKGVELNGIAPKPLPGRGIGIVATRNLKANERVMTIPLNLMRSMTSTPAAIKERLKGGSVHAILTVALMLETQPEFGLWRAVFPVANEILSSMPLCWPPHLQELLPPDAHQLLLQQQAKFARDWQIVHDAYPETIQYESFIYTWCIVNTRCFYHTVKETRFLPADQHLVMQPVADLFNHSPDGCVDSTEAQGNVITTTKEYAAGEEVFIVYGAHSNDKLLVEYGFILPDGLNSFDDLSLDSLLCPLFSANQRQLLEFQGYWGKYRIDADEVCYRTEMALRLLALGEPVFHAVLAGARSEDRDRPRINLEVARLVRTMDKDTRSNLEKVNTMTLGPLEEPRRAVVKERWLQIKYIVLEAIARANRD